MESEKRVYTCEICGAEFETPGAKGGHKRAHQLKISREELQAEIKRLAEVSGRTPTTNMMDEQGSYSAACVKQRFGSWGDALRSIDLMPNNRYDITPAEVKQDIRAVREKLGRPPTSTEHREMGEYSVSLAQDTFGSWNDALQAAGFEPHREIGIPDEVLLDEIRTLVEVLGKVPTATDMDEYGRFSCRCYFDRWDGWQAAVRSAGHEPVGRPSGPANGNWKADSKDERRYYGPNWKAQRAKALERDSYVCQTPGCDWSQTAHREAFGKGLHVHHIQPLSSFGDRDDDVDFERANRLENLVTVCVQHHRLWERVSPLRPDTSQSP
ncbi:HNH endonuclease [Natronobeatus ordinarius]|uniref:HNH endonuclease n=1 Tax=Natronobeatus ordinarius TaxID=2963433 RepID=UPI0020CEFDC7|nr:HNH endonuclease [Natronobeatus ordinarius]